jgi:thioredoxin-dependent peroxiredoxin
MNKPILGKRMTDFSAESTAGTIKLSDFKGKKLLLYFYPKDNTPGCTQEAQDFRDHLSDLQKLNVAIIGISRDSLTSHEKFAAKYNLSFPLISDDNESLCQFFDVIKMKNMYGKQVRGIERSSFLLDEEQQLIHEWRKVKVKTHVQEVLDFIRQARS